MKYCIGPMTKTVTDSVIDFCNQNDVIIGLIPSRRQVEFNGGYSNNWTTAEFAKYVRSRSSKIPLIRDHGGPNQGLYPDDGIQSMEVDCSYFNGLHLDVWKSHKELDSAVDRTCWFIDRCMLINKNIFFEIGTEEAIRRYEPEELDAFLGKVKERTNRNFDNVKYAVVQGGTSLKNTINTGHYDKKRLQDMIAVCKKYNLLSKEHNGDYISQSVKDEKFGLGLDCINIAPEFGVIETEAILSTMNESEADMFFDECFKSNKWVKWVAKDFNPQDNKTETIKICGHYIRHQKFIENYVKEKNIVSLISSQITIKLNELYNK